MKGDYESVFKEASNLLEERGKQYGDYMDGDTREYLTFTMGKAFRLIRDCIQALTKGIKALKRDTLIDMLNYMVILINKRDMGENND